MACKGMVKGMEIHSNHTDTKICEACLHSKQTQAKIQKTMEVHSDKVLGHMFSDVCGRLPTTSCQGYNYFITFIDDYLWKVFMVGLQEKSKVLQNFKELLA